MPTLQATAKISFCLEYPDGMSREEALNQFGEQSPYSFTATEDLKVTTMHVEDLFGDE